MRVPSGEKLTLETACVYPFRSSSSASVRASHTFAVLSSLPLIIPFFDSLGLGPAGVFFFGSLFAGELLLLPGLEQPPGGPGHSSDQREQDQTRGEDLPLVPADELL